MKASGIRVAARRIWEFIRELTGDDAYERYVTHHRAAHPDRPVLDQHAFYLREQDRKWSGITRCC